MSALAPVFVVVREASIVSASEVSAAVVSAVVVVAMPGQMVRRTAVDPEEEEESVGFGCRDRLDAFSSL